jgi:hypothetical protein
MKGRENIFYSALIFIGLLLGVYQHLNQSKAVKVSSSKVDQETKKNMERGQKSLSHQAIAKTEPAKKVDKSSFQLDAYWDNLKGENLSLSNADIDHRISDLQLVIDEQSFIERANANLLDENERSHFKKLMVELDVLNIIKIERKIAKMENMINE